MQNSSALAKKTSTKPNPSDKMHVVEKAEPYVPKTDILKRITTRVEVLAGVKIGPNEAADLLSLNTSNRPVVKPIVSRYTELMKNGGWIFRGGTINISKERVLQDGQKSLMAVVASGTTQLFNIQTGLEPEAFAVMDQNQIRSGGDCLAMHGFKDYNMMSAAIKTIIYWGRFADIKTHLHYSRITNREIEKWLDKKADLKRLLECMKYISQDLKLYGKTSFMAGSTWSFVYYTLSEIDRVQATEFVTRLATGENISMRNHAAVYLLREVLIDFGEGHTKILRKGGSEVTKLKMAYIFRAWNAWRKKEKVSKLIIDSRRLTIEKPE